MSDGHATRAARYLLAHHEFELQRVLDCADAVAAEWDGEATADREAVVGPMRAALAQAGLIERFPGMIEGAAAAAGLDTAASPVGAPPYVTITSAGPVLRTTTDGGRLVVTVRVFAVARDPVRYVRAADAPETALDVELL